MKRSLAALAVVLVLGAVGAVAFWYAMDGRVGSFARTAYGVTREEAVVVDIPPGTNPKGVSRLLAEARVVSDAELMYAFFKREKLGPKLRAGEYAFNGPLLPAEVAQMLVKGAVKQYRFTVPEGLRVDEILDILAASSLALSRDRLDALARSTSFIRAVGVPADSLEGFLLPDTYSFPRGATEKAVLTKMVKRTLEEVNRAPRKPGVTLDTLQAVTLGSIVEKETGAAAERPRISCVFHNRLRLNMKLQTDPTVIYAKMLRTGQYSKNITRADLTAAHPYNTYTNKGLPPGPIASPGIAALRAALSPIDCDDLFFVSRNDGTHVFCPDLKCHQANVQRWQVEFFRKKRN